MTTPPDLYVHLQPGQAARATCLYQVGAIITALGGRIVDVDTFDLERLAEWIEVGSADDEIEDEDQDDAELAV